MIRKLFEIDIELIGYTRKKIIKTNGNSKSNIIAKVYEWFEDRNKMFDRIVKYTDLQISSIGPNRYAFAYHNDIPYNIAIIETKPLLGIFKEVTMYMPKDFTIEQHDSQCVIRSDRKDMIRIKTYSQGIKQLGFLFKRIKEIKTELKLKEINNDF